MSQQTILNYKWNQRALEIQSFDSFLRLQQVQDHTLQNKSKLLFKLFYQS